MAPLPNSSRPPYLERTLRAVAVGSLLLAAGPASAQLFRSNVPGGSFDTPQALTYWTGYDPGYAYSWSFVDLDDSTESGSLLSENYDVFDFWVESACRVAVPGREYRFGAWQLTPAGQPSTGIVRVELRWYANCQTSLSLENPAVVTSSVIGDWTLVEGTGVAPAAAVRLRVRLVNQKTSPGSSTRHYVHFDEVFLPEPAASVPAAILALALLQLRRQRRPRGRD